MADTRWHTYRYTEIYIYRSASAREIKYQMHTYQKTNFRKGKSIKSKQTWFTGLFFVLFSFFVVECYFKLTFWRADHELHNREASSNKRLWKDGTNIDSMCIDWSASAAIIFNFLFYLYFGVKERTLKPLTSSVRIDFLVGHPTFYFPRLH